MAPTDFAAWSSYTVRAIGSPAVLADADAGDDVLADLADDRRTYVPIAGAGEYYDAGADERRPLADEQRVGGDLPVLAALELLADHPFLLVDPDDGDAERLVVTRADLNRRPVEAAVYPVVSTLADRLADLIEREYPDPGSLVDLVGPFPVGAWTKARSNDLDVHLAEFLSLTDMIGILKGNDALLSACGYDDPDELESDLYAVTDLRNRVMHGNRSLVISPGDVATHADRIDLAIGTIRRLDQNVDDDRSGERFGG